MTACQQMLVQGRPVYSDILTQRWRLAINTRSVISHAGHRRWNAARERKLRVGPKPADMATFCYHPLIQLWSNLVTVDRELALMTADACRKSVLIAAKIKGLLSITIRLGNRGTYRLAKNPQCDFLIIITPAMRHCGPSCLFVCLFIVRSLMSSQRTGVAGAWRRFAFAHCKRFF